MASKKKQEAPQPDQERLRQEAEAQAHALATVQAAAVEGPEGIRTALQAVQEVKARWADLEAQRKSATAPLNATIKTINGWFKPALDSLAECERVWKAKIGAAQNAIAAEERRLAEAAAAERARAESLKTKAAQQKAEERAVEAERTAIALSTAAAPSGLSSRTITRWEVIDRSMVPEIYQIRTIDKESIDAAIKRGIREIRGLRIWEEQILSVAKGGAR